MRDRWQRGKKWLKLASVETISLRPRAASRDTKEEMEENLGSEGTWLPYDLLFHVILLLPAKDLCRLRCVCKTLLKMIKSQNFVEAHFRQSETVLITRESFHEEIIKSPFPLPSDKPNECYFNFWDMHSGKGRRVSMPNLRNLECILTACNGLVLARMRKSGGLVVVNPSTWNHIRVPLGTIGFVEECYGFIFSHLTGAYKVVHLFHDESRKILCEILDLTDTRLWHSVDGPNPGEFGSIATTHRCVSAIGALYWLPKRNGCNHIISLGFRDEKFITVPLPISSTKNDRLVEVGGSLSFITHTTLNLIQVWILKRDDATWIKRYSINRFYDITGYVPLCASAKQMFFKRRGYPLLHIYNFEAEEMQEVNFEDAKRDEEEEEEEFEDEVELEIGNVGDLQLYMPHVKSLVSWDALQFQWDDI